MVFVIWRYVGEEALHGARLSSYDAYLMRLNPTIEVVKMERE